MHTNLTIDKYGNIFEILQSINWLIFLATNCRILWFFLTIHWWISCFFYLQLTLKFCPFFWQLIDKNQFFFFFFLWVTDEFCVFQQQLVNNFCDFFFFWLQEWFRIEGRKQKIRNSQKIFWKVIEKMEMLEQD